MRMSPTALLLPLCLFLVSDSYAQSGTSADVSSDLKRAKSVCLQVDRDLLPPADIINSGVKFEEPFGEITSRLFYNAGLTVISGKDAGCDAGVRILGKYEMNKTQNGVTLRGALRIRGAGNANEIDRPFEGYWPVMHPNHLGESKRLALGGSRSFIATIVSFTGETFGSKPLTSALADPNYAVRYHAASMLGTLGEVSSVDPLLAALTDKDVNVREAAAIALGRIGDKRALPALEAAVVISENNWRTHAVKAIANIKDPQANEALARVLKFWDKTAGIVAAKHLALRGDVRGCAFLASELKTNQNPPLPEAVEALKVALPSGVLHPDCASVLNLRP